MINKNVKTINLGWVVARITTQDVIPKLQLELFAPSDEYNTPQYIRVSEQGVVDLFFALEKTIR